LQVVRSNLLPGNLNEYIPRFTQALEQHLKSNWSEANSAAGKKLALQDSLLHLIFPATFCALFGEEYSQFPKEKQQAIIETFHQFDAWFEIASSDIPHAFLPRFTKAKSALLQLTKVLAKSYPPKPNPEDKPLLTAELMRENLGIDGLENWLLALLWAGEANTIPALFWCIYHLSEHPDYLARLREQIHSTLRNRPLSEISYNELNSMNLLRNLITETVRLHSPPIILRGVRADVKIGDYTIPKGHFLCLSPFWIHRDENTFTNAQVWDPDREDLPSATAGSGDKRYSFLSFGSGKYRCPGQSFAYLGLMLEVCLLVHLYDFDFQLDKNPLIDRNNLVGVTKPFGDTTVLVTLRQ
jgi:cytochrome P450